MRKSTHSLLRRHLPATPPRYIDYLNAVIDNNSRLLVASRPSPAAAEAAAKAAAAAAPKSGGKRAHGGGAKGPKGLGLGGAKGLGGSSGGGSGGAGGSSSGGAPPAAVLLPAAVRAAFASDHMQAAAAAGMRHLCQGLMNMAVALQAAGVLAPPPLPFNSAAERFEQRFGCLHILTRPEPLGYGFFETATDLKSTTPAALLAAAGAALGKVRL